MKMKSNGQGFLAKVLMLTLGMFMLLSVSAVTTSAQDRDWRDRDWRRNEQRREEMRRREEIRRQQEAQRQGRYNNGYYNNNVYRNNGYYGNNGYSNYGYGNAYGYNNNFTQTALNAGYNAGIQEGRRDRSRGGYRNVNDFSAYRDASKDYNSRLGDRYTYQQYFRQGFVNGYRDGLNGN
ncbi:MAG: hypothetical protein DMF67_20420 [Acidobacteria bacterium]|nr:MAG: hypothetical protein DMF67_20420 [Acidobacteriota bacterium]